MAAGVSDAKLNHAEVQETADRVAKDFEKLVTDVIAAISPIRPATRTGTSFQPLFRVYRMPEE